jgi:hypothetical protein
MAAFHRTAAVWFGQPSSKVGNGTWAALDVDEPDRWQSVNGRSVERLFSHRYRERI